MKYIVLARTENATAIKVSEEISRIELLGLLAEALGMVQMSTSKVVKPSDSALDVLITSGQSLDDD